LTYMSGANVAGAGIPAGGCIAVVIVTVPDPGGIVIVPVYPPTAGSVTELLCACSVTVWPFVVELARFRGLLI